ncbi:MAG: glycosyltransferase [Bacteriovoracia bacterium]
MKVAWVSTWNKTCGIADYSKIILPAVRAAAKTALPAGYAIELHPIDELRRRGQVAAWVESLARLSPDVVIFQHEYGIWGGKRPPRYLFPRVVKAVRARLPRAKLIATAHNVLARDYVFPTRGRGLQAPLRVLANHLLMPRMRRAWSEETWGVLDEVIVHSELQVSDVRASGCPKVTVIPHFVPALAPAGEGLRNTKLSPETEWKIRNAAKHPVITPHRLAPGEPARKTVMVFGFFSPEKGQDLAVRALEHLERDVHLVLAGGARRTADYHYMESCLGTARALELGDRVSVSGFVQKDFIDDYYARADLVLAPFLETTGSGSLAQALGRGAPILASDLPLNKEIERRQPGCLAFFHTGDPEDCARQIRRLLTSEKDRENLSRAALEYAAHYSPEKIGAEYLARMLANI